MKILASDELSEKLDYWRQRHNVSDECFTELLTIVSGQFDFTLWNTLSCQHQLAMPVMVDASNESTTSLTSSCIDSSILDGKWLQQTPFLPTDTWQHFSAAQLCPDPDYKPNVAPVLGNTGSADTSDIAELPKRNWPSLSAGNKVDLGAAMRKATPCFKCRLQKLKVGEVAEGTFAILWA
ncbi:hypothetical protein Purlil1_14274 [Purpureocillium lilacinum]|uniref:Uncharacterized protein n=1 Tax=Purpureocillium lilacinum TaxID=33203 RepID=A0ABR0BC16_PURLI|nr:hypothetical protein Purlil1_14274 [Purpureocillium lilacinum]